MSEKVIQETVDQVYSLLQEHAVFTPGEQVVIAVSGGVDSMVLLDIMDRLRQVVGIHLHVAHLDHQLRPDSAADCRFVLAAAGKRGLPCIGECRDVAGHARQYRLSLEAAARQVRYQFLDEAALRVGADKVLLGHQGDDQAETVLLRLVRGSGAGGLGAMSVVRDGCYVRPLLGVRRRTIEAYASAAGLAFREDCSNGQRRFVRNRIRHDLIPQLQGYNPHIVEALNRTAEILKQEDDYLDRVALRALEAASRPAAFSGCSSRKVILDVRELLDCHVAVQRRMVRKTLQRLSGRLEPFPFEHVARALDVARQASGRVEQIVAGLGAQRAGELFILARSAPPVEEEVHTPGEVAVRERGIALHFEVRPVNCLAARQPQLGPFRAVFDADLAGSRLRLRSPRLGDRFQPLGMVGHKKLSDFLVDLKWPRLLRDEVLLLTGARDEIVWVVGSRLADPFRVHPATRRIVLVEVRRLPEKTDGRLMSSQPETGIDVLWKTMESPNKKSDE